MKNPETEIFGEILRNYSEDIEDRLHECESPVERILALAVISLSGCQLIEEHSTEDDGFRLAKAASNGIQPAWPDPTNCEVPDMCRGHNFVRAFTRRCGDHWYSQFPVHTRDGSFRIDFAVLLGPGVKIAVEVDGHDFHEKTKEQAQRDKARDRALIEAGWVVVHFTGSEVWRDPKGCINQLDRIILAERTKLNAGG